MKLYQKMPSGFSPIDFKTLEKNSGLVVYDAAETGTPPKCLVKMDDEIILFPCRKLSSESTYTIMRDQAKQFDVEGKEKQLPVNFNATFFKAVKPMVEKLIFDAISEEEEKVIRLHRVISEIFNRHIENMEPTLSSNSTIHELIKQAYSRYVIAKLKTFLSADFSFEKMETFLKAHWETIRGTALCYTALPDCDETVLFCNIAEKCGQHKNEKAIDLLMPGIRTHNSFPDSFSELTELNIRDVLKTYILSEDFNYLIPVRLLSAGYEELEKSSAASATASDSGNRYARVAIDHDFNELINPCWAVDDKNDHWFLTKNELKRLATHNEFTVLLFKLKEEYDEMVSDKSTLWGKLNFLIDNFRYFGAHGGIGTEKVAASGVFPVIVEFKKYYDELPHEQKKQIPSDINASIEGMLALASEKTTEYQIERLNELPDTLAPGVIYIKNDREKLSYSLLTHKDLKIKDKAFPETVKDNEAMLSYLAEQRHIPESKKYFIGQASLIETCIASQAENLRAVISKNVSALHAISLSQDSKVIRLREIEENYNAYQKRLSDQTECQGIDHYIPKAF